MRIIAGQYRGRRLNTPTWAGLRPTSDKLRETLFNVVSPRVAGARVLDGYAGTGAVGIEALSRGASTVTFVEQHRRAVGLIRENLAKCGIEANYTIRCGDLVAVLADESPDTRFDLILLDPPYDIGNLGEALEVAARALAPEGLLVLERSTRRAAPAVAALARVRDLASGDSSLTFYTTED